MTSPSESAMHQGYTTREEVTSPIESAMHQGYTREEVNSPSESGNASGIYNKGRGD